MASRPPHIECQVPVEGQVLTAPPSSVRVAAVSACAPAGVMRLGTLERCITPASLRCDICHLDSLLVQRSLHHRDVCGGGRRAVGCVLGMERGRRDRADCCQKRLDLSVQGSCEFTPFAHTHLPKSSRSCKTSREKTRVRLTLVLKLTPTQGCVPTTADPRTEKPPYHDLLLTA